MIVSCYLEDIGLKSFIVKGIYGTKKPKFSKAHFLPLNFISINYNLSRPDRLSYIKEVKPVFIFNTIHSSIEKSTVIIFLSEILNSVFRDEVGKIYNDIGKLYSERNQFDESKLYHVLAMEHDRDEERQAVYGYNLSRNLLLLGEYESGWDLFNNLYLGT